ncbi:hypothetical protein AAFF_G00369410 [Aldrovandia affinis]|uniref:Uncharacterized protein n=1 Tax=Aldrovandia affinis TaxID=143900 RepID=A0AAD7SH72_9TELE|nr:hypothetical protein AAFF_G00369410 [Aldrovandia affinis]
MYTHTHLISHLPHGRVPPTRPFTARVWDDRTLISQHAAVISTVIVAHSNPRRHTGSFIKPPRISKTEKATQTKRDDAAMLSYGNCEHASRSVERDDFQHKRFAYSLVRNACARPKSLGTRNMHTSVLTSRVSPAERTQREEVKHWPSTSTCARRELSHGGHREPTETASCSSLATSGRSPV